MKHVTSALIANGCPKRFVINGGKTNRSPQHATVTTPDTVGNFGVFPYMKGTPEPIKRILGNYGVKGELKPYQTIGSLFPKPKDPVPKDQTPGAIYSIPYQDCDKSYIGETKRKFASQLKEHRKAVEHKQPQKSALAEHCLCSGHSISWESFKILCTSAN